ncbi:MAG: glutamine synthetase beta-grasp domain-containing protein [Steroidobacteraceae bacterium]
MTPSDVIKLIKDKDVKWADLRFTDTRGKEQHVTIPAKLVDDGLFRDGKMFDGSSISGWKGINESDMILMPEAGTAVLDPFFEDATVNIRCDVIEPATMQGYERDPRSLAKRAEAYLKSTGIADGAMFGPENEFFIFDSVRWKNEMRGASYDIDSAQGAWNSNTDYPEGNKGHRPGVKGGYFPVPPVDAYQDIRNAMCSACEELGLVVEVHHHEVATGGQCEIGIGAGGLVKKADEVQILKYAVHNVAHGYGKTATFMPKPLVGDNGSGMHVHQSLQNSERCSPATTSTATCPSSRCTASVAASSSAQGLDAFTNAGTNSPSAWCRGFRHRSCSPTRLAADSADPHSRFVANPKARRIEVRYPDSSANPYFAVTR